ncbi:MAG: hypothetical protein KDD60_03275, partial [Bdellovibrionales bacterium]|nr:hypothetical protein [Bdellovibrionales bacterium]
MFKRVLAVDPSLTCSGWAMFDVGRSELLAVGKVKAKGPEFSMSERLSELQERIRDLYRKASLGRNDVLICEAPTTMRDPRAALVVEQVRGVFETVARSLAVVVPGRINPRSVQYEVMGLRGKQMKRDEVKRVARHVASQLYGVRFAELGLPPELGGHQDIVDAVL